MSAERAHAPSRVAIERVEPLVDCGRFAVKAVVGQPVAVRADVFCDGHDLVAAAVHIRPAGVSTWTELSMRRLEQDRFGADVVFDECGVFEMTVAGWIDRFATWRTGAKRKLAAGVLRRVDGAVGSGIVADAADRAVDDPELARQLLEFARRIRAGDLDDLDDPHLLALVHRFAERAPITVADTIGKVTVARERAAFGAWYELFPRSWGSAAHGTLRDLERALPYVASMGFDVLYLPPIHPIGESHRKGPDNATTAGPDDVGSPWAIGSAAGGHTAVHPDLGTVDDVRWLADAARAHGMELALDLAYQCSPDHPWVREHPSWFRTLPDGSIQTAENPPKRYEDIYPIDFESEDWEALWEELESVVRFWIAQGVVIFRVDNPHTKPFAFWEWMIDRVRADHPDVIFLAEAFTRPTVMYRLAKAGFDQSYTYFAWRQSPEELRAYLTELTQTERAHHFRPNAWPNTPDILTEQLQWGGRATFVTRLVLAATLFANYGIYGPVYELQEDAARTGAEEYAGNEKYELRTWDIGAEHSLAPLIGLLNRIRHRHRALQTNQTLVFHTCDNPTLLCYSKTVPLWCGPEPGMSPDPVLVVVNTDPHHRQTGYVHLDLAALGISPGEAFVVRDAIGGGSYRWTGPDNYVELDPHVVPAHVFAVRRHARSEHDFDYF